MALRLLSALAACRLGAAALAKIAWQRRLAAEGSEGLELQLALPEEELRLKLWRNTALLAENARHVLHYKDGTQEEGPGLQEHCFFLGQVEGHPGSSASFSACEGRLSGLVLRGNRTLWIDPAEGSAGFGGGEGGRRLRGEALHEVRSLEGDALDMVRDVMRFVTRKAAPSEPSGRRLASTTKYVEVLAVNDFSRFTAFGGQASLSALATHTVSVLNTVTAIFRASPTDGVSFPHSVQVVLTGQHTFLESDPWDQTVKMQGPEVSEDSLLEAFLTWSAAEMASGTISENDNRLLLSGRDFVASTVGYAPMSSMCDLARSGSINMCGPSSTDVAGCAATVAHEMGHNFGMSHDSGSCPQSGLVMAAVGTSDAADQFSSCSVSDITTFFTKVYDRNGQCLENKPSKVFGDPVCGNGFREEGEDCDCGSSDCSSLDTCCNGATCRFADPSYECSDATGACCESCKNVTAAAQKVCRAARSSCDLAEICAGGTSQCPKDEYVYPGASCSLAEGGQSYAGLCSMGSCHSMAYTCAVDVTRDFAGTWDLSTACAGFNDDCATVVCHDATSSSPAQCGQYFSVHGIHMPVPDGTPCWHPSEPLGLRSGMCFQGQCRQPGSLAVVGLCGNGGIDYGEECDCGASGAGDPCCDCASCTLKSSSACAGTDPCCDSSTCSLKAAGTVCRAAVSGCDVAESCSGASALCPPDEGKKWGTACTAADGAASTCYGKQCLASLDAQCKAATEGARPIAKKHMSTGLARDYAEHVCTGPWCCESCEQRSGSWQINGVPVEDPHICSGCTRSTTSSTFTVNGVSKTIYLGAALDGTSLADSSQLCIAAELSAPAASCGVGQFLEASVGRCLACDSSCGGCMGPTALDCDCCRFGAKDARGACRVSEGAPNSSCPGASGSGTSAMSTTTATETGIIAGAVRRVIGMAALPLVSWIF